MIARDVVRIKRGVGLLVIFKLHRRKNVNEDQEKRRTLMIKYDEVKWRYGKRKKDKLFKR